MGRCKAATADTRGWFGTAAIRRPRTQRTKRLSTFLRRTPRGLHIGRRAGAQGARYLDGGARLAAFGQRDGVSSRLRGRVGARRAVLTHWENCRRDPSSLRFRPHDCLAPTPFEPPREPPVEPLEPPPLAPPARVESLHATSGRTTIASIRRENAEVRLPCHHVPGPCPYPKCSASRSIERSWRDSPRNHV